MTSLTDSRGSTVSYTYNTDRGYVKSETDAKGTVTNYTYTPSEQLSTVSVSGSTVQYGYNSAKQLSTITTPGANGGSVYGITYDTFGRKVGVTVGGDTLATYTYNAIGQTETVTYGNGAVTRYVYDSLGRLTQTVVNDVPQTKTVYDGSSRVHEQYDLVGERKVQFEYDILGREVKRSLYDTDSGALLSAIRTRYDDAKNRIAGYEVTAGGETTSYTYNYGENNEAPDLVTSVKAGASNLIENEYDFLNRLSTRTLNTTAPVETTYTYLQGSDPTKTTTLVSSMQTGNEELSYTYDANGNILSISKNGSVVEAYTYDSKNQLTSVTRGTDVWTYTYDANGNIQSVKKNGEVEKSYGYTDSKWKDKLTSFNGSAITYDAIGNPLQYRNGMSLTWSNGRKLSTLTKAGATTTFTYDGEGNRIRKVSGNTTIDYIVIGGTIYGEIRTVNNITTSLHYLFDENGTRIGFVVNSTDTYYYRFNLQGDVTGIYNASGTLVAEYAYDAWGNLIDSDNTDIANLNPIRYRGYYYDVETGFYYLHTRYYDPVTGRFINADGLLSTGQGILSYNMYAYCLNNPVNFADPTGFACICLTQRVHSRHVCDSKKLYSEMPPSIPSEPSEPIEFNSTALVLAQTIYGESGGRFQYPNEWKDGMQAVGTVIVNRFESPKYTNDYTAICTAPGQFVGYARGKEIYDEGNLDAIMWDEAMRLAINIVSNAFTPYPQMNSQYIYFHSATRGDAERRNRIKQKPEVIIKGGNMFYCTYP